MAPTYDFMPVKHAIFINIYTSSILRVYFNVLFHASQGLLSDFVHISQYAYDFFVPFHIISPIFFLKIVFSEIFTNFLSVTKKAATVATF